MVMEVRVDHMKLVAEQHREDCLVVKAEERMAELMKLMAEENKEGHVKLEVEKHWAEHMKSKVDFLFLTSVLHLCFPSSLAQPEK